MIHFRSSNKALPWIALILFSVSGTIGCGGPAGPPSATLEGKVTVDAAPANSGNVLVSGENGSTTTAQIQPDGSYTVVGLAPGTVKITVVSQDQNAQLPQGAVPEGAKNPQSMPGMPNSTPSKKVDNPVPIPTKYAEKSTSGLATTLKVGKNTLPLELSSK